MSHAHHNQRRFEALFQEHARAVLGYALRRTRDPEDAADVVAETFTVAWRRIDSLPDEAPRLWLYAVARRVLANARRGDERRSRLGERLQQELAAMPPDFDPEDERVPQLRVAMDSLSAEDRELLRLAFWEDLAPHEIATVLDLQAATVRTRLHRARLRLRDALSDPLPAVPVPIRPTPIPQEET